MHQASVAVDELDTGDASSAWVTFEDSDDENMDAVLLSQGKSVKEPFLRVVALLSEHLGVCVGALACFKSLITDYCLCGRQPVFMLPYAV